MEFGKVRGATRQIGPQHVEQLTVYYVEAKYRRRMWREQGYFSESEASHELQCSLCVLGGVATTSMFGDTGSTPSSMHSKEAGTTIST